MRISDWRSDGFSSDRDLVGRNPSVTDELIVRRERTGELGRDLEIYASANGVAARPHQVVAGDHVSNIAVRRLRLDRKARRHRITERSRHGRLPFDPVVIAIGADERRSEEHTSELQSLMRISYAVFCLKKKNQKTSHLHTYTYINKTTKSIY